MERAVIMSRDKILHRPSLGHQMAQPKRADGTSPHEAQTLAEADREHILRALRHTDWVIGVLMEQQCDWA